MIELCRGNLLEAQVEALVNAVNTEGVMGKGIALQFKKAFPASYQAYRRACDAGHVQVGKMLVFRLDTLLPRYIVQFPTKKHWRNPSRIEYVEAGLTDLVEHVRVLGIKSLAVPALGCGNGGLAWADVKPRIEAALEPLPEVRVLLFEPAGAPALGRRPGTPSAPE